MFVYLVICTAVDSFLKCECMSHSEIAKYTAAHIFCLICTKFGKWIPQ